MISPKDLKGLSKEEISEKIIEDLFKNYDEIVPNVFSDKEKVKENSSITIRESSKGKYREFYGLDVDGIILFELKTMKNRVDTIVSNCDGEVLIRLNKLVK